MLRGTTTLLAPPPLAYDVALFEKARQPVVALDLASPLPMLRFFFFKYLMIFWCFKASVLILMHSQHGISKFPCRTTPIFLPLASPLASLRAELTLATFRLVFDQE
jgi:hypothetical protein